MPVARAGHGRWEHVHFQRRQAAIGVGHGGGANVAARLDLIDLGQGDRAHLSAWGQVHDDVLAAVDLDVHRVALHRRDGAAYAHPRDILGLGQAHGHGGGKRGSQEHLVQCDFHDLQFPVSAVVPECIITLRAES